jgi:hypothetical protein
MSNKIGRMPTAEIVGGPWRPLQARKRRAVIDNILAGEDSRTKCDLIDRLIRSLGYTPLEFTELSLQVLEDRMGIRSTKWQRIEDERKRA